MNFQFFLFVPSHFSSFFLNISTPQPLQIHILTPIFGFSPFTPALFSLADLRKNKNPQIILPMSLLYRNEEAKNPKKEKRRRKEKEKESPKSPNIQRNTTPPPGPIPLSPAHQRPRHRQLAIILELPPPVLDRFRSPSCSCS